MCVCLYLTLCDLMDCSPPAGLLCPWGFSRQECWSGLPFLSPGDLPDSGIEPTSLISPALAGGFFTTSDTWVSVYFVLCYFIILCDHHHSQDRRVLLQGCLLLPFYSHSCLTLTATPYLPSALVTINLVFISIILFISIIHSFEECYIMEWKRWDCFLSCDRPIIQYASCFKVYSFFLLILWYGCIIFCLTIP